MGHPFVRHRRSAGPPLRLEPRRVRTMGGRRRDQQSGALDLNQFTRCDNGRRTTVRRQQNRLFPTVSVSSIVGRYVDLRMARSTARLPECGVILRGAAIWTVAFLGLVLSVARPAWSGDEAATVIVVRRPFADVLRTFAFDPAIAPYYLVSKMWSILPTPEFELRLLSVLAMATSVLIFWLLSSRFMGRRAGCSAPCSWCCYRQPRGMHMRPGRTR